MKRFSTVFYFFLVILLPPFLYALPQPDHVVIVMESNHSYDEILGSGSACCTYINSLANSGAKMTQSYGTTYPSQPNYLELFSGSTQGITDNSCPVSFTSSNLAAELLAAGWTFRGYEEDLPSAGSTVCATGNYTRRHNPWVDWQEGGSLPVSINMPFAGYFPAGPDYSSLPTLSFVIPNLANDMNGGTPAAADGWLQTNLDGYVQWAKTHNSLLIVDWDEDDASAGNNIPTIFSGPMVCPGSYGAHTTHDDLLRTLLDMYGLLHIGNTASARQILEIFACATPTSTPTVTPTPTNCGPGTGLDLSWSTQAPMSIGRYEFSVGVVDGILYVVGGLDQNGVLLNSVEAYDPLSNTWTTKAPMPTARSALAVGVVNGVLYAVGGGGFGGYLNVMEAYDPLTDSWTTKSPMPTSRDYLSVGVTNGILYAVDGFNVTFLNTVEAYDPSGDSWATKAPTSLNRFSLSVGVVNGILYAVGGAGSTTTFRTVEAYDPLVNIWTTKASMPTARFALGTGVVNGMLYALGGIGGGAAGNNINERAAVVCAPYTPTPTPTATASPTCTLTLTPTITISPTITGTPTTTGTVTPTPIATFTPTDTITFTPTPTASPTATPTLSPTLTVTPLPSSTPTITSTPTNTPTFVLGRPVVLYPNPVVGGGMATLRLDKSAQSVRWKIYDVAGELVDSLVFGAGTSFAYDCSKLASGLYLIFIDVSYTDGTMGSYRFHLVREK